MQQSKKIITNATWIIGCRIAQAIASFLVSIFTARFLGPSNYGLINYAASVISFVIPIAQLGLGNIQVQELIDHSDEEGSIVGTSLLLSIVSSIACIIGVTVFTFLVNAGEEETIIVVSLYSIILFFQGADLMHYWFQAHYISKYASLTSFVAFIIVSGYRVLLLVTGASIYWFAISNAFDSLLILIALLYIYHRLGGQKIRFSSNVATRMIHKSKYYIIANMMVAVFTQTDRLMLKLMLTDSATGYYAVAASFAGIANFVFVAIIDSVRPAIFQNKKRDHKQYERTVSQLFCIIIYLTFIVSVVITILAPYLVRYTYGGTYYPSINVLRVLAWYTIGSYIGSVRNVWILAEGKQSYVWKVNIIGALSNVILNYILIPIWGATGAALASVITQLFTNVISTYMIKALRPSIKLMINGLNPRYIHEFIDSMKNNINRKKK